MILSETFLLCSLTYLIWTLERCWAPHLQCSQLGAVKPASLKTRIWNIQWHGAEPQWIVWRPLQSESILPPSTPSCLFSTDNKQYQHKPSKPPEGNMLRAVSCFRKIVTLAGNWSCGDNISLMTKYKYAHSKDLNVTDYRFLRDLLFFRQDINWSWWRFYNK